MEKLSLPNEQTIRTYIEEIFVRGVAWGKTKIEFHNSLQDEIAALANKFFLTPEKEFELPGFRGDNHNSYIDVVWSIGSIPIVAIEIDSALRQKSVKKLLASNANLLFWVYYGVTPFESLVNLIDVTHRVNVIHFPLRFEKPVLKSKTTQDIEVNRHETNSSRSYSFTNVRLKYPNAYMAWTEELDKYLKDSFQKGSAVSKIAKDLQRSPGAIRSRIKKIRLS